MGPLRQRRTTIVKKRMPTAINIHSTRGKLILNPSERYTHELIVNNFNGQPWSGINRPGNQGRLLFCNEKPPNKVALLTELNFLNPSID